jgi:hypothetical protein
VPEGSVADTSLDSWHDMLRTDLTGAFHGCTVLYGIDL